MTERQDADRSLERMKIARTMHRTITGSAGLFLLVVALMHRFEEMPVDQGLLPLASYVSAAMVLIGIAGSVLFPMFFSPRGYIPEERRQDPQRLQDLSAVQARYQTRKVIQWTAAIFPCFVCTILYLLTGELVAAGAALVLVLYIVFLTRPGFRELQTLYDVPDQALPL